MKRSPSFVCKRAKEIVQYTKVFHEYLTIGSKYMSKTSKVYSLLTLFLIFITLFAFNIAAFVYFNGAQRPACRPHLARGKPSCGPPCPTGKATRLFHSNHCL